MRKETIFFGLVAIALIGFVVGRLTAPEPGERPAAPDPATVSPETTAVVPVPAAAVAADDEEEAAGPAGAARVRPLKGAALRGAAAKQTATEDATKSPAKGPVDAKVTMIVVSDFECPYCRRVIPTMERLLREYDGDLRVVWKNNPLPFHHRATPAAIAALAAHRQGRFWAYHDKLFEAPKGALDDAALVRYARELGLDVAQFRKDMDDPRLAKKVTQEQESAKALGARGTPSFFINGKALVGAKPYAEFKAFVEEALVAADEALAAGTPPAALHATMAAKNHPEGEAFVAYMIRGELPDGAPTAEARPPAKRKQKRPSRPVPQDVWKVTVEDDDPSKGAEDALVTIVEFSDFECPFCSKVNPTIAKILETFPGDVRIVWKNNPLPFHRKAGLAAEAALAAHAQGKFWEYHDLLFENQRKLDRADLERYAEQLGLDMAKFRAALDQGTYKDEIAEDQALASKVNARGTPNLFVNGRQIVGARPFEDFEPLIREEIEKAKKLVARGVSRGNVYDQLMLKAKTFEALDAEVKNFSTEGSPALGPDDAKVVIAEFSDFQCPYCSRVGAPLKAIQKRFPDRVKVVFKNFPLVSIHPDAHLAAEAALEAGEQGKFWPYHDLLFQNQKALKRADLETYAEKVGLDMAAFRKALDDRTHREAVRRDMTDASRAGVRGTPTVFINGRLFKPAGGISEAALEKVLAEEFGVR